MGVCNLEPAGTVRPQADMTWEARDAYFAATID